jgi:hypothetical protein
LPERFSGLLIAVVAALLAAAAPCSAGDGPDRVLVIDSERADLPL